MDTTRETTASPTAESQLVKLAFGDVLLRHRLKAGFKQRAFSRAVGISNSHLRSIEAGVVSPTLVTLFKMASTLDEDPAQLIAETRQSLIMQPATNATTSHIH